MIWWWWILPAAAALIGLVLLVRGLRALFGGRAVRGVAGAALGGGVLWLASLATLFGLNLQTYDRLTYERPVASLELRRLGPQYYEIELTPLSQDRPAAATLYPVHGDDWRIDAQVLKWKPWANVLGLDSQYRLERLSGRYRTVEQELTAERSAYDLAAIEENARNGALPIRSRPGTRSGVTGATSTPPTPSTAQPPICRWPRARAMRSGSPSPA